MDKKKIVSAAMDFAKKVSVIIRNNTDKMIDTKITVNNDVVFNDKI